MKLISLITFFIERISHRETTGRETVFKGLGEEYDYFFAVDTNILRWADKSAQIEMMGA